MKTGMILDKNLLPVNYDLKKPKSHSIVNYLRVRFSFDLGKKSYTGYTNSS